MKTKILKIAKALFYVIMIVCGTFVAAVMTYAFAECAATQGWQRCLATRSCFELCGHDVWLHDGTVFVLIMAPTIYAIVKAFQCTLRCLRNEL